MTADSPQVQALRQRYQQSLTEKSSELSDFLTGMSDPEVQGNRQLSDAHASEVGEYLHKLAGSAGMYGYSDIAELARSAMTDCRQVNFEALFTRLNELRNLLDQHA